MVAFRGFLTLLGVVVLPSHLLRVICVAALGLAGVASTSNLAIAADVFTAFLTAVAAGVIAGVVLQVASPRPWAWLLAIVVFLEGGASVPIASRYGVLWEAQASALLAGASALLAVLSFFVTRARQTHILKEPNAR